ncbi:MAG: L-threonylcarbamoyladenylate synthase [Ignavibacteria bacterium]|nr:L-threonylcarbamoyladenylate synthase [Ignavibacteria bacterium]
MLIPIHPVDPEPRLIRRVAETLRAGGIIVYPTDTVYGIGCSIEQKDAIEQVYLIKRQRNSKPFSFVCSDLTHISTYAHVSNPAFKIMKRLVPGPYTFILPAARMRQLPRILISKRKTVGIRVPEHNITQAIVKELGHPILSTSATHPETGEQLNDPLLIREQFGNQVRLVIDGGLLISEPSSVIDLTGDQPVVVRKGAGDLSTVL